MAKANLKFSTDIIIRLGEELNPSPDQSILELVKNSYDADARHCIIELTNTSMPGGTVKVCDDGDGMDLPHIRDGWLVLGRSKKNIKTRTRLGRIPAGSKGLGRLAALRMGSRTLLCTRPRTSPQRQYQLDIDWSVFDKADLVEEVDLLIESSACSKKNKPGTEIILSRLIHRITRSDVKKLARSLLLLADPFADNPEGFQPILQAPEFVDLVKLVKCRYYDDAEYHLVAEVNKKGEAAAFVKDWKGEDLFSADHKELSKKSKGSKYICPSAKFDLWVFILNSFAFSTRKTTMGEVQKWLKVFGGVHLYQNGLRVSPYGNPGNDWLDMNLRRARSPEERPSTNTSIGRVSVFDTSALLTQKTDRSGFIESDEFLELRRFATDMLDWMALRRVELAEKRRAKARVVAPKKSTKEKTSFEQAIKQIPKKEQNKIKSAFTKYDDARRKEVINLRKEVQLYRTLSTAGITAATFAHESGGNPIKVISFSINTIGRRGRKLLSKKRYDADLAKPVERIKESTKALQVLGIATLELLGYEKRRSGRVEIHKIIHEITKTFAPFLKIRNVKITKELTSGNPYLRGSVAAIESILTNLLNNAIVWLEDIPKKKRAVVIRTSIEEDILILNVLDSGPGINDISLKDIWLPGQTTRPNGTGLGLTIIKDAVVDLGGNVTAVEQGELGGAEFIVELPILGV